MERRATEPVRWPPIDWGVGGSRQMRISCNPLLLFIWAEVPFCLPFKCRIILIGKELVLKTSDGESHCRFESCVRRHLILLLIKSPRTWTRVRVIRQVTYLVRTYWHGSYRHIRRIWINSTRSKPRVSRKYILRNRRKSRLGI